MVTSQEMSLVLKVSAQSPHIENYTLLKIEFVPLLGVCFYADEL